jgi:site-specific DNA-methyltransferase (adenine-specific)
MIQGESYTVHIGNNLDILPTLPDNSVDSIVTDPPYELGFMGKKWDSSGIAYSVELWRECLRVLKPGGHLLSFGGTRTWHRVAVGIEDAGFEVRDSIAWMYGSGFPKSLDVSKAIDKQSGYDGAVIGTEQIDIGKQGGSMHAGRERKLADREIKELSPEAQQWKGWGTALKPAFEPIVVARKPLVGTVAENVVTHGTGALNIDGSRIGTETIISRGGRSGAVTGDERTGAALGMYGAHAPLNREHQGRWPANVILDEYSAEVLDEQSGITTGKVGMTGKTGTSNSVYGNYPQSENRTEGMTDKGGASRFYYVAKASKRDRNEGLEELPEVMASKFAQDAWTLENMQFSKLPTKNFHPTVKPTQLMRYLVKLVTPPGGTVLDPFTGSGSTGKAAILEGFRFIGCELTEDYIPIIEGRLKHAESMAAEAETKKDEALF